jgi:hypothetical protein
MTNYADPTISLADHLAAAIKPIGRTDVAFALADLFGSRVNSGQKSVLANALLNGDGIDKVLAEIRDLLDGTTAVEQEVA